MSGKELQFLKVHTNPLIKPSSTERRDAVETSTSQAGDHLFITIIMSLKKHFAIVELFDILIEQSNVNHDEAEAAGRFSLCYLNVSQTNVTPV